MAYMYLGDSAEVPDQERPARFGTVLNWLGACMSLALIGGLTYWGYDLAVRDVAGVPVVRALEGPMRLAPEDPGGRRAAHQGLAVNSVAADGTAEPPPDRLVLAPAPLQLADEDLPRADLDSAPATDAAAADDTAAPDSEDPADEALALADALAEGVTPLSAPAGPGAEEPGAAAAADAGRRIVPPSVAGVARSPLPRPRPVEDLAARAIANDVVLASAPVTGVEVDADALPVGTRLVQFGAFDTPDAARAEWDGLDARFTDFLDDKSRVIQRAVSGGKTFYRLRAMNFADINDARRFCSAFLAERQPCIPVVTR